MKPIKQPQRTGNKSQYTILALIFATISFCSISCNKDDFNTDLLEQPSWTPELAFPLVYSEVGISDLVHVNDSNTTIVTDPDQFCTLIYHGRAFEFSAAQLVSVPNQYFQRQYSLNNQQILTLGNSGQVQVNKSQNVDFNTTQGVELDSMQLKDGSIKLTISSDFTLDASVLVQIPSLIKNGIPFSETIQLDYGSTTPVEQSLVRLLSGYKIDLTASGTGHNKLTINYQITLNGNASGVTTGNFINCKTEFDSLKYSVMFGYIGQQSLSNIQDSIEISIFNNSIGSGSFSIAEPKVRFDISNSLGIPFSARLTQLTALHGNLTNFVVATGIPDPLPVQSPTSQQLGQVLLSSFSMDKNNSNVVALIDQQPKYLISQSQITTNPNGRNVNFLLDTSRIAMDMHVELPFYGTADNFKIKDTVPFSYNDLDNVEALTLRIALENGFPLESSIQLVFADSAMQSLDTLFTQNEVVIASGVVDPVTERVTIPGKKLHDIVFSPERISKILNAKHIFIVSSATTFNNGSTNVKIYNDYKLKVKIGAIAKMKIQ